MLKFDVSEFLQANQLVAESGGGAQEVADLLGIRISQVWTRRYQLRRKGIDLPRIRKSPKGGRRRMVAAKKVRTMEVCDAQTEAQSAGAAPELGWHLIVSAVHQVR